jgi:hypothetical protein
LVIAEAAGGASSLKLTLNDRLPDSVLSAVPP